MGWLHNSWHKIEHSATNVFKDAKANVDITVDILKDPKHNLTIKNITKLIDNGDHMLLDAIGMGSLFDGQNKTFKKGLFTQIGQLDKNKQIKQFISGMLQGVTSYDYEGILYNMNQMVINKGKLTNLKMYDNKGFAVKNNKPYIVNDYLVKSYFIYRYRYSSLDLKSYEITDKYLNARITSDQYCGDIQVKREYFDEFINELEFMMLPIYHNYKPLSKKEIMLGLTNNGLTYNSFIKSLKKNDNNNKANFKDIFLTYSTKYSDPKYKDIIEYIYGTENNTKEVILSNKYYTLHYWWDCITTTDSNNNTTTTCTRKATLNGEGIDVSSDIYILPINLGKYLTLKDFISLKNQMQTLGMYVTETKHLHWYQTDDMKTINIVITTVIVVAAIVTGNFELLYIMAGTMAANYVIDQLNISPQAKAILHTIVAIVAIVIGVEMVQPTGVPLNSVQISTISIQITNASFKLYETFEQIDYNHKDRKLEEERKSYEDKLKELQNSSFDYDFFAELDSVNEYTYSLAYDSIYDYDRIYD